MTQLLPPRVLGIDLSLTCTGLAGPGWTDTIKPHPKMRGTARMMFLRSTLLDRYLNGLDLVAIEGPSYGSQAGQSGHHERAGAGRVPPTTPQTGQAGAWAAHRAPKPHVAR